MRVRIINKTVKTSFIIHHNHNYRSHGQTETSHMLRHSFGRSFLSSLFPNFPLTVVTISHNQNHFLGSMYLFITQRKSRARNRNWNTSNLSCNDYNNTNTNRIFISILSFAPHGRMDRYCLLNDSFAYIYINDADVILHSVRRFHFHILLIGCYWFADRGHVMEIQ